MVVNEGYRVFVCNTVTGKIMADLVVSDQKWGLRLNEGGPISVTIRPYAEEYQNLDVRGLTKPLLMSLGIAYDGRILECGPIWVRDVDADTGNLSVEAEGLSSIFDRRKAVRGDMLWWGAPVTGSALNISGSLGDIARELVRISLQDNPFGVGGLNVVLPPVEGGSAFRTYPGFELGWIGERLKELTEVRGGPDIRFTPRFSADPTVVEWVMETGSTAEPLLQQTGADWTWDGNAPDSGVVGFGHTEDAREMGSKAWVPGSGQERAMKIASANTLELTDQGMPWTEVDVKQDVEDQNILQDYADQLLDDSVFPWNTFKIKVRADQFPMLGEYLPGDWANIVIPDNHPTLMPGPVRVRIMAVDGDGSNGVSLTVTPVQVTTPDNRGAGVTTTDSDHSGGAAGTWSDLQPGTWNELPTGTWNEVE